MPGLHASTRLGDLLVKKGKISRQQLLEAIRFQQERRLFDVESGVAPSAKSELGNILIELGYISRKQLRNCLSWQRKLRKMTLVMTFFAPLLTVACGGGGSGGGSADVIKTPVHNLSSSSSVYSSTASVSSKVAFSSSSISSSSQKSSSSSSSSVSPTFIDGHVLINWMPPTHRENGEYLDIASVGGYELRYRLKGSSQYKSIQIGNGYTDSYYFDYLKGDYEFEIAAYDTYGQYSDFVPVERLL